MTAHWKNLPDGVDWIAAMLAEVEAWEKNFDIGVPGPMGSTEHIQAMRKTKQAVLRDQWAEVNRSTAARRLAAAREAPGRAEPVEQKPLPLPKAWKEDGTLGSLTRPAPPPVERPGRRKRGRDTGPSSRPLATPPRPAAGHRELANPTLPGEKAQQSERETILTQLELHRLRNRMRVQTGGGQL
jgi:hypothetical protein